MKHTSTRLAALTSALALLALPAVPALADVSVTINGNPASFAPGPIERAGRIFVPLRGMFENLGASVVYEGGVINATRHDHAISLRIGSNQATVDGQPQTLDVAPFIVGASTYVPLRFISQALGATVNYDASNQIVAITRNGGGDNNMQAQAPAAPPQSSSVELRHVSPGR
ncbi:MAG TPA: copper amine oxidase N-terminal domain-containing protein, partial [Candidatus Baltobacteraceae bacterium]